MEKNKTWPPHAVVWDKARIGKALRQWNRYTKMQQFKGLALDRYTGPWEQSEAWCNGSNVSRQPHNLQRDEWKKANTAMKPYQHTAGLGVCWGSLGLLEN